MMRWDRPQNEQICPRRHDPPMIHECHGRGAGAKMCGALESWGGLVETEPCSFSPVLRLAEVCTQ